MRTWSGFSVSLIRRTAGQFSTFCRLAREGLKNVFPSWPSRITSGSKWAEGLFEQVSRRRPHRHFQERAALRRHTANHCQAKREAQQAPGQKVDASGTQVGTVMMLSSRVTAAFNASALPIMLAPVFRVMLWSARILPRNDVSVPRVAEGPTCQKTWHA